MSVSCAPFLAGVGVVVVIVDVHAAWTCRGGIFCRLLLFEAWERCQNVRGPCQCRSYNPSDTLAAFGCLRARQKKHALRPPKLVESELRILRRHFLLGI